MPQSVAILLGCLGLHEARLCDLRLAELEHGLFTSRCDRRFDPATFGRDVLVHLDVAAITGLPIMANESSACVQTFEPVYTQIRSFGFILLTLIIAHPRCIS